MNSNKNLAFLQVFSYNLTERTDIYHSASFWYNVRQRLYGGTMFTNFISVAHQVLILFILIAVGFLLGKTRLMTIEGAKTMSNIVLFAVTPCVIVEAFQREYKSSDFKRLMLGFLISSLIFLLSIVLIEIIYRKKRSDRITVIKFAIVFSNAGFMGLPLQRAILGDDGVFFGAAYVAMFNIVMWTYGYFIMSGKRESRSMIRGIINPGVLGTAVALALYVLNIRLPDIILSPVSFMADLNTPVPMLIVGFYLASCDFGAVFGDRDIYTTLLLRLIVFPSLAMLIMYLAGVRESLFIAMVISCSTPTPVATTLMATRYNKDTAFASSMVSASSLVSIVTMSFLIALAQTIA